MVKYECDRPFDKKNPWARKSRETKKNNNNKSKKIMSKND